MSVNRMLAWRTSVLGEDRLAFTIGSWSTCRESTTSIGMHKLVLWRTQLQPLTSFRSTNANGHENEEERTREVLTRERVARDFTRNGSVPTRSEKGDWSKLLLTLDNCRCLRGLEPVQIDQAEKSKYQPCTTCFTIASYTN